MYIRQQNKHQHIIGVLIHLTPCQWGIWNLTTDLEETLKHMVPLWLCRGTVSMGCCSPAEDKIWYGVFRCIQHGELFSWRTHCELTSCKMLQFLTPHRKNVLTWCMSMCNVKLIAISGDQEPLTCLYALFSDVTVIIILNKHFVTWDISTSFKCQY